MVINSSIMTSITPLLIIFFSWLIFKTPTYPRQFLGIILSLIGVIFIISKANFINLIDLNFTKGDLWMLSAVFSWGLYSVLLKKIDNTPKAPSPLGPYNQGVMAGNMFFTSGQIAINCKSGELVLNNIKEETQQVMENLKEVLNTADLHFSNVVKTSIFITSMSDFNDINEVYGSYFDKDQAPARETVEVAKLPKGVNVEISMIAIN